MKRNSSVKKTSLLLTVLCIVFSVSLLVGATLALFTDTDKKGISFESGKLDVESTFELTEAWSYSETAEDHKAPAEIIDNAAQYSSGTGSVSVDPETGYIKMTKVAAGDMAVAELTVQNVGDIHFRYRVTAEGDQELLDALYFTADGEEIVAENGVAEIVAWTSLSAGTDAAALTLQFGLPVSAINGELVSGDITINIEAVQSNAPAEGTIVAEGLNGVTNFTSLESAVQAVNSDKGTQPITILLTGDKYELKTGIEIKRDNVTLQGMGMNETTVVSLNGGSTGAAAVYIGGAKNVTVKDMTVQLRGGTSNASPIKVSFSGNTGDYAVSDTVMLENLVLSGNSGYATQGNGGSGLNIHGANNVTINNVVVSDYGKVGISLAYANGVDISNVTFAETESVWGDIGMMYDSDDPDNPEYAQSVTDVVLGEGIEFGMRTIYNERPGATVESAISGTENYGFITTYAETKYGLVWGMYIPTTVEATPDTIDAALASLNNGDTLALSDGAYGTLDLTGFDRITVVGAGAGKTVIAGHVLFGEASLLAQNAHEWNLSGVTVTNPEENVPTAVFINSNSRVSNAALNISDSVIANSMYGVQLASGVSDCALNLAGVKFENVFCAVSVKTSDEGASGRNTYNIESCTYENVIYQLQTFYPSQFYAEIGGEAVESASNPVMISPCDLATVSFAENTMYMLRSGEYTVSKEVTLPKGATLFGMSGAVIKAISGTTLSMSEGSSIISIEFDAAAITSGTSNVVQVTGSNVAITNCSFTGAYDIFTSNFTVRGLATNVGVSDITVSGCSFVNLRQPAYVNGTEDGAKEFKFENNYVKGTRGFVIAINTDATFTGNVFENNIVDIAFITDTNTTAENANNYDIVALSSDNSGCYVQDQFNKQYCDDGKNSVAYESDTIADVETLNAVLNGAGKATYYVSANVLGEIAETLKISASDIVIDFNGGTLVNQKIEITGNNVVLKNLNVEYAYSDIQNYQDAGAIIVSSGDLTLANCKVERTSLNAPSYGLLVNVGANTLTATDTVFIAPHHPETVGEKCPSTLEATGGLYLTNCEIRTNGYGLFSQHVVNGYVKDTLFTGVMYEGEYLPIGCVFNSTLFNGMVFDGCYFELGNDSTVAAGSLTVKNSVFDFSKSTSATNALSIYAESGAVVIENNTFIFTADYQCGINFTWADWAQGEYDFANITVTGNVFEGTGECAIRITNVWENFDADQLAADNQFNGNAMIVEE